MSTPKPFGVDAVDILDSIPAEQLRTELDGLMHDAEWESPVTVEITPGVAVQLTRLVTFDGIGASVEVLVREDVANTAPLVTMSEGVHRIAEQDAMTVGEVSDEKKEAAVNLSTRGGEVQAVAPVCTFIQGLLTGIPKSDDWTGTAGENAHDFPFTYMFDVAADGVVVQDPSMPYDQGRVNPFDVPAHVFITTVPVTYSVDEMPDEILNEQWAGKQEQAGRDSMNAPAAENTPTSVGEVFYNTNTDEYCWVIAFDPVLGAILQYEDGTCWDQQLRPDGVPAGPYENTELPDDYDAPVPDPENPCDVDDHDFGVSNPHSYHDFDPGICVDCGLATSTLIEMYSQWPLDRVTFECIGCGETGLGEDLIDSSRLEETALCGECWDPSLSAQENYEKHSNDA